MRTLLLLCACSIKFVVGVVIVALMLWVLKKAPDDEEDY